MQQGDPELAWEKAVKLLAEDRQSPHTDTEPPHSVWQSLYVANTEEKQN